MPTFRLVLEYDGSDFEGWQTQRTAVADRAPRTVQGVLDAALRQITGVDARVHGAGRTDAGVHAEAQLAHVELETRLEAAELRRALNAVLPRDVAVLELRAVDADYHARRDARSKTYVYRLWTGETRSPLRARRALHVARSLDLEAMRRAAAAVVGTHDFASFRAAGGGPRTSVRTITRFDVVGEPGGELRLEVTGTGFLRHMVRNLVGTLLEVGQGKRPAESLPALIAACDRGRAGPTAPAHGLTLERVDDGQAG